MPTAWKTEYTIRESHNCIIYIYIHVGEISKDKPTSQLACIPVIMEMGPYIQQHCFEQAGDFILLRAVKDTVNKVSQDLQTSTSHN